MVLGEAANHHTNDGECAWSPPSEEFILMKAVASHMLQVYSARYSTGGNCSISNPVWSCLLNCYTKACAVTQFQCYQVLLSMEWQCKWKDNSPHGLGGIELLQYPCKTIVAFYLLVLCASVFIVCNVTSHHKHERKFRYQQYFFINRNSSHWTFIVKKHNSYCISFILYVWCCAWPNHQCTLYQLQNHET